MSYHAKLNAAARAVQIVDGARDCVRTAALLREAVGAGGLRIEAGPRAYRWGAMPHQWAAQPFHCWLHVADNPGFKFDCTSGWWPLGHRHGVPEADWPFPRVMALHGRPSAAQIRAVQTGRHPVLLCQPKDRDAERANAQAHLLRAADPALWREAVSRMRHAIAGQAL